MGLGLPLLIFAAGIGVWIKCKLALGSVTYTKEELDIIHRRDPDADPNGIARDILNCAKVIVNPIANWGVLAFGEIWSSIISPELSLIDESIEKYIVKECDEYKANNDVECWQYKL